MTTPIPMKLITMNFYIPSRVVKSAITRERHFVAEEQRVGKAVVL